jgi:MYXO-CTERM domain-containing protein
MKNALFAGALLALAGSALAAPLTPRITGHDINFGAYNSVGSRAEYITNGAGADSLQFTQQSSNGPADNEADVYRPNWPTNTGRNNITNVFDGSNGGDVVMNVIFNGSDNGFGAGNISLTGIGASTSGADFQIFGSARNAAGNIVSGLLWQLRLDVVALYGYANQTSYVLEGAGNITGGLLADGTSGSPNLLGQLGVIRGNLDFFGTTGLNWMPAGYTPSNNLNLQLRAAFSGETGTGTIVPTPGAAALVGLGGLAALRRRR